MIFVALLKLSNQLTRCAPQALNVKERLLQHKSEYLAVETDTYLLGRQLLGEDYTPRTSPQVHCLCSFLHTIFKPSFQ